MEPRFLENDICLLRNERGITLIEVLVSAVIMVVLITSIYIGIQYANRQAVQNYRHRAATLIAAGELERQYFYYKHHTIQSTPQFDMFQNKIVDLVPLDERKTLQATQNLSLNMITVVEHGTAYDIFELRSIVEWNDPVSGKPQRVVLHEDFYRR